MPVVNPFQEPSESIRFNTLDWIPRHLLMPDDQAELAKTGFNSEFPIALKPREAAKLFWEPRNIAISELTVDCDYFFFRAAQAPVFPESHRPNGTGDPLESGLEADKAHKLIYGFGERVALSEIYYSASNGRYLIEAAFQLNPLAIKSNTGGIAILYSMTAAVAVNPMDASDKRATGRLLTSSTDTDIVACGSIELEWVNNPDTGEPHGMTLSRLVTNPIGSHVFSKFDCTMKLDLVEWDFI